MSRVYNSWSEKEDRLLLNYVVEGIQVGEKIGDLLSSFSETYMISRGSALNRWQKVSKENELLVKMAKLTWRNWGKPEKLIKEKEEKEKAKRLAKLQENSRRMRKQWREEKKKKSVRVTFETTNIPHPRDSGIYIKVDEQGLVSVKRVSTQ